MKFLRLIQDMVIIFSIICAGSCGSNAYQSRAPESTEEKAQLDMEAKQYGAAQSKLEKLLAADAANYRARSLLAACHAAQGGIVIAEIVARQAATAAKSGSGSSGTEGAGGSSNNTQNPAASGFSQLKSLFGEATAVKIDRLKQATDNMKLIPTEARTTEMTYQAMLFSSAYAFLLLEKFWADVAALSSMTTDDASAILGALADAITAAGGANSPMGKTLNTMVSAAQSAAGNTDKEKLATWISSLPKS